MATTKNDDTMGPRLETLAAALGEMPMQPGVLHGVGLGPGHLKWVTMEAASFLWQADLIYYIRGPQKRSRSEEIGRIFANPKAKVTYLNMPSKESSHAWQGLARTLLEQDLSRQRVALACLGDPLLFGSLSQILPLLPASLPVKVIPGLWAGAVAAAELAQPWITYQQSLVVLCATLAFDALLARLSKHQSAVILKIKGHEKKLYQVLESLALLKRAWVLCELGTAQQSSARFTSKTQVSSYFSLLWIAPDDNVTSSSTP